MKRREIGNLLRWIGWGDTAQDACASWTHLLSLYADSQATPKQAQRVEAHLAACPQCRASLALLRATTQVARTWANAELPAGLSERLQHAIAEEARRQRVEALDAQRRPRHRFGLPHLAFSGAALAAILAFGVYFADHSFSGHPRPRAVVAAMPSHLPPPRPGMGVPHGGKPTDIATQPTPHPAGVPRKTVVAELPQREQPSIPSERPVIESPPETVPVPHSVHANVTHPVEVAKAIPVHPSAELHPHLKPRGPAREEIARAVKPPVSEPSESDQSDDDEMTTPAPQPSVVASVPKPAQDTPVVTLASQIKNLARNTQHVESGTDQVSVAMTHTVSYGTGAATIVGSDIH